MLCSSTSVSMSLPLILSLISTVSCQTPSANASKRGIAYVNTSTPQDLNIFINKPSPIKWYFNWSPFPETDPSSFSHLEFVPQIADLAAIPSALAQIPNLPSTSMHLLTFNEPDIDPADGGSLMTPADAAQAYLEYIVPLSYTNRSNGGGKFLISHPATTGTDRGINWIQQFNASCWAINTTHGCHADFVATHFYGDLTTLAPYLAAVNQLYNNNSGIPSKSPLPIWLTEFALQQNTPVATEDMMNVTLPYLDGLDYIGRYSWFGMFRTTSANSWTGSGVSLLNAQGGLSELGAMYLGGNSSGYFEGMSATGSNWPNTTSTTTASSPSSTGTGKTANGAGRGLCGGTNWSFLLSLFAVVTILPYLMFS